MDFTNKNIHKTHIILLVVIVLLVIGNIFFAIKYYLQVQKIETLQQQVKAQQTNAKVVNFLNLFIAKVLQSNTEVSFDDRLKLENAIRALNDPELLAKWEQFTGGQTVDQIQQSVKDLLAALVKKITY
jgi:hypothetical protein